MTRLPQAELVPTAEPKPEPGAMVVRTPDQLLTMALEGKADVGVVERLIALHERAVEKSARLAFFRDFAIFQGKCGLVPKNRESEDRGGGSRSGSKFSFGWADLEGIAEHVNPILFPLGFSYSWNTEQDEKAATAIFILRHKEGHQEEMSRARCGYDSSLPISPQQKNGVALSYAKRYSIMQGLALITGEGEDGPASSDPTPITEQQAADLQALVEEVGMDKARLLAWQGVQAFSEILAARYDHVVAEVRKWGREKGAK